MVDLEQLRPRELEEALDSPTLLISSQLLPLGGSLVLLSVLVLVFFWIMIDDVEVFAFDPPEETDALAEDGVALEVVGGDGGGRGE